MMVHILYSSIIFSITKKSYEKLEFQNDISLNELIYRLVAIYGEEFAYRIFTNDKNELRVPIFRNGKKINLNDMIYNEDRITMSFICAGG